MNTILIATLCLAVLIIAGTTQAETVNDLLANSKPGDTGSVIRSDDRSGSAALRRLRRTPSRRHPRQRKT